MMSTLHPDPTREGCTLTMEPEPKHNPTYVMPYLPSFQYPMGTTLASNQLTQLKTGFKGISPLISRGIGETTPSPLMKSILAVSDNRSSEADDSSYSRNLNNQPLLLGNGNNLTSAASTPNGYFVRQIPAWNNGIEIPRILHGRTSKFGPGGKDRWLNGSTDESSRDFVSSEQKKNNPSKEFVRPLSTIHPTKGFQQAFPLKLFDLVTEQNNEIICWLPEGNAFKVRNMENFVHIILPAYFKRKLILLFYLFYSFILFIYNFIHL